MTEAFFALPPERLIAFGRLTFAAFALFAIWVDPSQPAQYSGLGYSILGGYLVYAAAIAVLTTQWEPQEAGQIGQQAIDISVFGVLMHITEGPTSPFFVLFTFALFAASLRWGWRATITTAVVLLVVLFLVTVIDVALVDDGRLDLNRLIMRSTYLLVVGVLLAYVSAFRERSRDRLAKLALWPPEEEPTSDKPQLGRSLAHAAEVLPAEGLLVIWEAESEPWLHIDLWSDKGYETLQERDWEMTALVGSGLETAAFAASAPGAEKVKVAEGWLTVSHPPIAAALTEKFTIGRFATAPFDGGGVSGRVFILEPRYLGEALLPLTEIVASRMHREIEHFQLRRELTAAERARERVRLARDIHDGVLQDLTAADLKLRELSKMPASESTEAIANVCELIRMQQTRIREFVDTLLPKAAPRGPVTAASITQLMYTLSRQWGCDISTTISPHDFDIPDGVAYQVSLLLAEAIANSVRHGQASAIRVEVGLSDSYLTLRIRDDGKGGGQQLRPETIGAKSIRHRVSELGGELEFDVLDDGVQVSIRLPLST